MQGFQNIVTEKPLRHKSDVRQVKRTLKWSPLDGEGKTKKIMINLANWRTGLPSKKSFRLENWKIIDLSMSDQHMKDHKILSRLLHSQLGVQTGRRLI